jgi:16S rRNA (cytosine967-C5)-methyltransferase
MRLASHGHTLVATDVSPSRLQRVEEASARLGLGVETAVHDWEAASSESLGLFDGVLVDAPCTGLGTIRRRPEIRWRRLLSDPAAMAIRQLRILQHASLHVKEGGKLAYSVCSPSDEEGRGVVDQLEGWSLQEEWRNLPPEHGEDVFQCFLLERRGDS